MIQAANWRMCTLTVSLVGMQFPKFWFVAGRGNLVRFGASHSSWVRKAEVAVLWAFFQVQVEVAVLRRPWCSGGIARIPVGRLCPGARRSLWGSADGLYVVSQERLQSVKRDIFGVQDVSQDFIPEEKMCLDRPVVCHWHQGSIVTSNFLTYVVGIVGASRAAVDNGYVPNELQFQVQQQQAKLQAPSSEDASKHRKAAVLLCSRPRF
ncbi:hypothetical protein Tco_0368805 [Tanacetum coccineum]